MINKFLSRLQTPKQRIKLSDEDLDDIDDITKQFRNTLICGATFGAIRDVITIILEDQKPFYTFTTIALDSLNTGLELSTFGLFDGMARVFLRPNTKSLKTWIPWTLMTSASSTLANRMIMNPLSNYYFNDNISMKGYFNKIGDKIAYDAGFNMTSRIANQHLPKSEKLGGEFARSTSTIAIGSLGATIASAPFVMQDKSVSFGKLLRDFGHSVPLVVIDNALYTIVQKSLTPYLK
ncbi:hypothetical protein M9Y10_011485 [Tritrichomonas musculus]|uniref:Uncharacterized protein n=1 Tax=Tritrichomonas musculus TaxID=1915356 RepID=A0ABR2IL57_9EUKA